MLNLRNCANFDSRVPLPMPADFSDALFGFVTYRGHFIALLVFGYYLGRNLGPFDNRCPNFNVFIIKYQQRFESNGLLVVIQ